MFDISERRGGWLGRLAFSPSNWKRPCPCKCVFTPICLSGSFHESLRFPLDGRAFLHVTTHKRDILSSDVYSACHADGIEWISWQNKIVNFKIARCSYSSSLLSFSFFLFFFLFSEWYSKRILGISSSILAIFHRRREKRLRKWNWFWWSWLCYCVIYLRLSKCCTRRTLLDNWNHVILHWKRVIKIYVWKDCPRFEFHFYIWHDICYLHFTCRLFVSP